MQSRNPIWLLTALLALVAGLVLAPVVTRAANTPELKLEYVGFQGSNNDQLITFKVTNVGTVKSAATVLRVVTSHPEPTPSLQELDVPALAPGESVLRNYPLAAPCNDHLVRALLVEPPGATTPNPTLEQQVCPALPPIVPVSPPDLTVDYGACAGCNVPAYLQPGPDLKTLVFKPAVTHVFGRVHQEDNPGSSCSAYEAVPLPGLEAGFYNFDDLNLVGGGCRRNVIWQAGFRFDLNMLREARARGWFPTDAVLTFKEIPHPSETDDPSHAYHWRNGEGDELPTQTCWLRLAVATVDWDGRGGGLVPNDVIHEAGEIGRWNVYGDLGMMLDPANERQGFLLLGQSESMDDNQAGCWSRIEDLQLAVSYTIGSGQPATPATPAPLRVVEASTIKPTECVICAALGATPTPQANAYHPPTTVAGWPQLSLYTQGEAVTSLQYLLQASGATLSVDGKFGPLTDAAVRAYQKTQGLTVDGIVGVKTWQDLIVTVQQGSQGAAVKAVQSQLKSRNVTIAVDGDFGSQTDLAVRAYQKGLGLIADGQGVVSTQTWQALLVGR